MYVYMHVCMHAYSPSCVHLCTCLTDLKLLKVKLFPSYYTKMLLRWSSFYLGHGLWRLGTIIYFILSYANICRF